MLKFERKDCPELKENEVKWTKQYLDRIKNRKGTFYWPNYPDSKGNPISSIIIENLLECTQNHCAYCDKFPLYKSDKTIDHFRPKRQTKFPELAYNLENLFPACDNCQTMKLDQYSEDLLKPDEINYNFNSYFYIDFTNFTLIPNPKANSKDQNKALTTIKLFNLNDLAHITSRRHSFERYNFIQNEFLDDFAYRYLFV